MRKLIRFLGGCLFGAALLAAFPAPSHAQTKIVLVCTATACCTVDEATGQIIDCRAIRT